MGKSLSGIGGVETGSDAAEFILLGSDTVQVRVEVLLIRCRCFLCIWRQDVRGALLNGGRDELVVPCSKFVRVCQIMEVF